MTLNFNRKNLWLDARNDFIVIHFYKSFGHAPDNLIVEDPAKLRSLFIKHILHWAFGYNLKGLSIIRVLFFLNDIENINPPIASKASDF